MKKMICLLLALLMLLTLTGCGGGDAAPAASTASLPLADLVKQVMGEEHGLNALPKSDLEDILGIDPADHTAAVYLQDEMAGRELLMLRAGDEEAAGRIKEMLTGYLEQRRKETRNYLPEAYKLLENAVVTVKGRTVLLLADENAATLTTQLLAGE